MLSYIALLVAGVQVVGVWRFTLHEMVVFETIDAIDRRIQVT